MRSTYCITDDILKAIGHLEDKRRTMNNASILTTVITGALFFGGNQETAREYMVDHGLMPNMLSKSRFNRCLHAIDELMGKAKTMYKVKSILTDNYDGLPYGIKQQ